MSAHDRLPGWYTDPDDLSLERFWNGSGWSEITRPGPKLDDYLGPIEPLLLQLLTSSSETEIDWAQFADRTSRV